MEDKNFNYKKLKKKYLKFLSTQEVMSEPFRDKLGQLNKFYLPISKLIREEFLKKKKDKSDRSDRRARNWKINYFKYFKNNSQGSL